MSTRITSVLIALVISTSTATAACTVEQAPAGSKDGDKSAASHDDKTSREVTKKPVGPSEHAPSSNPDDETPPTADPETGPIAEVWKSVDYLPWNYSPDGCFARSYYVTMELASRGVPSSQLVVNLGWMYTANNRPTFESVDATKAGTPPVTYLGKPVHWQYHIAALILPPAAAKPTIFDKAIEVAPVPSDTWVGHVNAGHLPKSTTDASKNVTTGFDEFTTFGSTYVGLEPSLLKNWDSVSATSLSTMPSFKAAQVKLACDTVWTVYDCMNAPSTDPRRKALVDRTNELAASLAKQGLLSGWDGKPMTCGPTQFLCAP